jgi:hypothetical protein
MEISLKVRMIPAATRATLVLEPCGHCCQPKRKDIRKYWRKKKQQMGLNNSTPLNSSTRDTQTCKHDKRTLAMRRSGVTYLGILVWK